MANRVNFALNRTPPYLDTEVPYERTKAAIEVLLKSYGVKGIRWTSLEGQDDVLEFIIEAEVQGVKKQLGIAVKPPHIYTCARKQTCIECQAQNVDSAVDPHTKEEKP